MILNDIKENKTNTALSGHNLKMLSQKGELLWPFLAVCTAMIQECSLSSDTLHFTNIALVEQCCRCATTVVSCRLSRLDSRTML